MKKVHFFVGQKTHYLTVSKLQKHIFCCFKNGKKSIFAHITINFWTQFTYTFFYFSGHSALMSKNSTENSIFFNLLNADNTSSSKLESESNQSNLDLNLDHVLNNIGTIFGDNNADEFLDHFEDNTG